MTLQKTSKNESTEIVSVLVEPQPGHSDEDVVGWLRAQGAQDIEILGTGFVSARLQERVIHLISDIAIVHRKNQSQPNSVENA